MIAVWLISSSALFAGVTDFAEYWTAARQALHGRNPYASAEILGLERGLGFAGAAPLVMRNPPWTIPFVLPSGLLPYEMARRFWFLIGLAMLLVSAMTLQRLYGSETPYWLPMLWATTFTPMPDVLGVGQIAPLVLLGLVGFLHFERKRCDTAAGLAATLMTVKPHLVYLFWPVLLFWVFYYRRWRVLGGLALGMVLSVSACLVTNPGVFSQYRAFLKEQKFGGEMVAGLGGLLVAISGGQPSRLVLLPVAGGLVWVVFHWFRKFGNWNWRNDVPLVILVSSATVPYAWPFDQIVLLPALVQVALWSRQVARATRLKILSLYLLLNGAVLVFLIRERTVFWYIWTTPAWLVFYLVCRKWIRPRPDHLSRQYIKLGPPIPHL